MKYIIKFILYHKEDFYMGISIQQFRIAMEVYGATRLPDCLGSRYRYLVPCFCVAGTDFYHSGSYYIVKRGNPVTDEIMNRAMAEFGEIHPGGDNFWWGEIHSIKGILTLAAMLENKYSKELINELTNETYKRLLSGSFITKNVEFPFCNPTTPKREKLYQLLMKYSDIVNPFGNEQFSIKEPIQYLDTVGVHFGVNKEEPYQSLSLINHSYSSEFLYNRNSWTYNTMVPTRKNHHNGYICFSHHACKDDNQHYTDEVLSLRYKVKKNSYHEHPSDIDLNISLKTGLAWKTYKEEKAKPATDKQMQLMITYLEISIEKIRSHITRYMINT